MESVRLGLKVEFAGIKFPNPIFLASGFPIGYGSGKILKKAALAGAGGVVARSVFVEKHEPCIGIRPRYSFLDKSSIHIDGVYEGVKKFTEKELKIAKEGRVPVIVSILGRTMDEYLKLAKAVEKAGAEMIEVNLSCPSSRELGLEEELVGLRPIIAQMPEASKQVVKRVREVVSVPLMTKLTAFCDDIGAVAKAVEDGGADAVAATNTLPNVLAYIDLDTGKPPIPTLGVYGGAGIKPLALGAVVNIAKSVKIPISGIGGVSNWRDAVEMIMAGATTVQVCTAALMEGFGVFKKITRGIEEFMDDKRYKNITDFRGIALKHIYSLEEVKKEPLIAAVNKELCTGCNKCVEICAYEAPQLKTEKIAHIDPRKCVGCGLCLQICPFDAISMKKTA